MAVSKDQWNEAFQLLSRFERKIIDPSLYSWDYLVEQTGISKPTLWRNSEFKSEHQRIKKLVDRYIKTNADYDLENSQLSKKDQEIKKLKERILELEQQLDHERERLAYAAMIARRNNIEPSKFEQESPLIKATQIAIKKAKDKNNDPLNLDRFRK